MEREECVKLVRTITAIFPNWKPMDLTDTVDAWNMMLEDYNYKDITIALKSYIQTNKSGFAPSVSQLIDYVYKPAGASELPEAAAWAMVRKAISRSTYYSQEEFEKFPETVQKAVGTPEMLKMWAADESFNEGVTQSHFISCYRNQVARHQEYNRLPGEMQRRIAAVAANLSTQKYLRG